MSAYKAIRMNSFAKSFFVVDAAAPAAAPVAEPARLAELEEKHFREHSQRVWVRTDHIFAGLFILQWLAGIGVALWITPLTWVGAK